MKMHVLDLGQLTLDQNLMVAGSHIATASNPHAVNALVDIPVSGYCIEHSEGNILYDLGCNPDAMGEQGRWSPFLQDLCPYKGGEECQLPNRLEQLGLGPDDIRYAVLSHLHNDHAGCVEYFRKTKLIVHESEFDAALRAFGTRDQGTPYVLNDIAAWTRMDLDWYLFSRDQPSLTLAEGVTIHNWGPGHSHGMLGLQVELREAGSVILTSDAVYQQANFDQPPRLPGVVHDPRGAINTVERIRELARQHNAQVWFGHDPQQFATLRTSTEGWYE